MDIQNANKLLRRMKNNFCSEDIALAAKRISENVVGGLVPLRPLGAQGDKDERPTFSGLQVAEAFVQEVVAELTRRGFDADAAAKAVESTRDKLEGLGQLPAFPTEESAENDGVEWANAAQMAGFVSQAMDQLGL